MDDRHALSRAFVVLNPMAGNCTAQDVRQALERHFSTDAWICEIYETTGEEQVAEALVGSGIPLGIIPVGTANVFAHELGLPFDLEGACALLADDHATTEI